jgi:hypothetical protein
MLAKDYNKRINREYGKWPNLVDRHVCREVGLYLTYYCLLIVMAEYRKTRDLADEIKARKVEMFEFLEQEGCTFGCPLPQRFCLPCKH